MDQTKEQGPAAPDPARGALATVVLVGGAFVVAFIRLAGLVRACAVNVPFQDQWDLLRPLFQGAGPWAAFRLQHGPHRQGLGGVIDWFLYRATAWDVRAEAWAAVGILTLAAVAAIALAVRLRGRLHWTDAGFPLVLMSPVHWETMLLTPNLAHGILPLLLVLCLAHAWLDRSPLRAVLGIGMLGALCQFTGFAFCAAFASAGLAALRWLRPAGPGPDRRTAALVLLGFGVALLAFGWGYRWDPAVPGWRFPVSNWWDYPRFVAFMFASLAGWRAVAPGALALGAVLVGLVLLAFGWTTADLWRRQAAAGSGVIWLLTGTSLAFAAFTAIGRLPVNIEAAFMWRYLPLLTPAVCGVALFADLRTRQAGSRWRGGWGVLWLGLAAVIWGNFTPDRYAVIIARGKTQWIEAYLATRDLAAANRQADFFVYRGEPESPVIAERLRWLEERKLSFFHEQRVAPPGSSSAVPGR